MTDVLVVETLTPLPLDQTDELPKHLAPLVVEVGSDENFLVAWSLPPEQVGGLCHFCLPLCPFEVDDGRVESFVENNADNDAVISDGHSSTYI